MSRTLRAALLTGLLLTASPADPSPVESGVAVTGGRWLSDTGFTPATRYLIGAQLTDRRPARIDSTIALHGAYVVSPFGEAHNHNIEASSRIGATLARYLRDGVFYVENPGILPRNRPGLSGLVNVPTGPDVTFAPGLITGAGGHPVLLVRRNIAREIWTEEDGEGAFYWTVDSAADLERKWPRLLAAHPDFIKVVLIHSEEYERRRADTAFIGWRGMNPALLAAVVRRATAAGLRVVAHIETASDFRAAVAAGVAQIAHMPGFRGDEQGQLPDPGPYTLSEADAKAAAVRGEVVVTTLGGVAALDSAGPDSVRRRAFDALHRANLATLRRAGVRLAIGSDAYGDDSRGEARYLQGLGVFTNAELLRLWSEATPRAIFPERPVGRLTPPAVASFLALSCDPLVHFACTDSILVRVKDGRVLTVGQ